MTQSENDSSGDPRVWFVTGSSRGLGRELVQAILDAGDQVVATARQPQQLAGLVDRFGDRVLPVRLDVTDPAAVAAAVRDGVERFGRLDVVVNNAGYANVAAIETGDEDDFRRQFEANFWSVYQISRAIIPQLRAQGGGTVVQVSSIGGRVGGSPGIASYQAAKFRWTGSAACWRPRRRRSGSRSWSLSQAGSRPTGPAHR